jgi:hypothetical protein
MSTPAPAERTGPTALMTFMFTVQVLHNLLTRPGQPWMPGAELQEVMGGHGKMKWERPASRQSQETMVIDAVTLVAAALSGIPSPYPNAAEAVEPFVTAYRDAGYRPFAVGDVMIVNGAAFAVSMIRLLSEVGLHRFREIPTTRATKDAPMGERIDLVRRGGRRGGRNRLQVPAGACCRRRRRVRHL